MFWDTLIGLGLLGTAAAMAWMGVRVSLYPPNAEAEKKSRKKWFLRLGGIAAVLTIAQGIRNGLTQQDLLDAIARNKPTITVQPTPVTVNNLPSIPTPKQGVELSSFVVPLHPDRLLYPNQVPLIGLMWNAHGDQPGRHVHVGGRVYVLKKSDYPGDSMEAHLVSDWKNEWSKTLKRPDLQESTPIYPGTPFSRG